MADHALATITNPSAALTDFSLIVDLSRMPASWWTAVDTTDGTRGRVYKGDGTTRLAADWIDFDDTAETGLLRVLWSGTLATTGTQQLWIEPPVTGNATVAADNTYGSDNAYRSALKLYLPMEEDPSGTAPQMIDRTANSHDGTTQGTMTSGDLVAAPVGNGLDLDGTDDYVQVANSADFDFRTTNYSISMWVIADATQTNWFGLWAKGAGGNDFAFQRDSGNNILRTIHGPTNYNFSVGSLSAIADGAKHKVDLSFDGSNLRLYVDGIINETVPAANAPTYNTGYPLNVGASRDPIEMNGVMDEFSIAAEALSADWISSEYDQTNDNATFWGTWSWETSGGGTTYSVSASDGISLSDSPSGSLTITASASDGVSLADSPSGALRITASVSDGVSFADSSGGASTIPLTVADAIILSDEVLTAFTFGVQASDGVTLSDQATEGGVIQVTASDGIVFSDSASAVLRILAEISDGVTFSDETSATGTISATVSDGVTFSDAVTTALRVVASVSDGVRLSDVAIDSTFLPVGRVQIRVTTAQASVTITAKQPGVSVAFE